MRKFIFGAVALLAFGFSTVAAVSSPAGWVLDGAASTVAFGSVKKDVVGESHHFSGLSGSVNDEGDVMVQIDLTTVETQIDIRNERIGEFVFMGVPNAEFSAKIDLSSFENLAVGGMQDVDLDGVLTLGSTKIDVVGELVAVRISDTRVMVLTSDMIWVSTEEAGIDAGVSKLMELASLSGITRTFPVTLRLIFDHKM